MSLDMKTLSFIYELEKIISWFRLKIIEGKATWGKNSRDWEKTFDAIDDWICIIDLDSTILRSNRAVEKYFQISVQESIGLKCCKLIHGTDSPINECPLPMTLKTKKRMSAEVKIKDDRWLFITVDPIFSKTGNMINAVHIARDVTQRILIQEERNKLFLDLKKSLAQIKTLSGLVPICSYCKKIRDDKGYWSLLESYIEKHSEVSFSHGMCPECSEKLYGREDWYIEMKKKKRKKENPG